MKILVTGSAGFICGYVVEELLSHGHSVVGIDNFSKYGKVKKSYDDNPNYKFIEGDAKNLELMKELVADCDQVLAAAAMIGGISYFHEQAYEHLMSDLTIAIPVYNEAENIRFAVEKIEKEVIRACGFASWLGICQTKYLCKKP